MAAIRIPASAEPLLPLCRSSGSNGAHVWETYADLVAFLAAYGYSQEMDPPESFAAAKSTNPIDLSTFRNRGLYPQLLMVAIAVSRGWMVAKSPDEICAITERYATVGGNRLGAETPDHPSSSIKAQLMNALQVFDQMPLSHKDSFTPI
jgi:hypothetical protein